SSLSEEKQFTVIQRPLSLRNRIPMRGGGGPMGNGPEGGSGASPARSPASAVNGPRGIRRLARVKGWFCHKPRPEVVHALTPSVRHQSDPPAAVLSFERCGFDYTITRIE